MYVNVIQKRVQLKFILFALLVPLIFCGCSSLNIFSKHETPRATPEGLYARASEEFKNGHYKKAQEYFLRVKEEYPLHDMAILAEIGIADSLYSDKEYTEAETAYSDFISLHPVNENVPYALFQVGMCHYNQIAAIDRDQTETIKAKDAWEKLVARYPESKFFTMAEKLIRECKQKLAEHDFYVGKFYFRQKKYHAALSRFENVAREYANVGLDYKVEYYIAETKAKIVEEETIILKQELEKKEKEEKEINKKNGDKKSEKKKLTETLFPDSSLYWSETTDAK